MVLEVMIVASRIEAEWRIGEEVLPMTTDEAAEGKIAEEEAVVEAEATIVLEEAIAAIGDQEEVASVEAEIKAEVAMAVVNF
jgi:hypothetical protein